MTHAKTLTAGALAALLALGTAPVMAQTATPETAPETGAPATVPETDAPTTGAEAPAATFPQEKIDAFVLAAVDLSEVRAEYQQKIATAATEDEKQKLVVEGQAKMAEAVEKSPGITVEEYGEIGAAAQADPELAERLTMLIEEKMGTTPSGEADG